MEQSLPGDMQIELACQSIKRAVESHEETLFRQIKGHPGGKERVCVRLISGNTRFLHENARVLPHGTDQNHSFPVQLMTKSTWSYSDSARVLTFSR